MCSSIGSNGSPNALIRSLMERFGQDSLHNYISNVVFLTVVVYMNCSHPVIVICNGSAVEQQIRHLGMSSLFQLYGVRCMCTTLELSPVQ